MGDTRRSLRVEGLEGGRGRESQAQSLELERPCPFQIVIHRTVHGLRASKTASA